MDIDGEWWIAPVWLHKLEKLIGSPEAQTWRHTHCPTVTLQAERSVPQSSEDWQGTLKTTQEPLRMRVLGRDVEQTAQAGRQSARHRPLGFATLSRQTVRTCIVANSQYRPSFGSTGSRGNSSALRFRDKFSSSVPGPCDLMFSSSVTQLSTIGSLLRGMSSDPLRLGPVYGTFVADVLLGTL